MKRFKWVTRLQLWILISLSYSGCDSFSLKSFLPSTSNTVSHSQLVIEQTKLDEVRPPDIGRPNPDKKIEEVILAGRSSDKKISTIFIHSNLGPGFSVCSSNLVSRVYCSNLIRRFLWSQLKSVEDLLPFCNEDSTFSWTDSNGQSKTLTCNEAGLKSTFDVRIYLDRNYADASQGFVNRMLGLDFFNQLSNDSFVLKWIPDKQDLPLASKGAFLVAGKTSLATNYAGISFLERAAGVFIAGPHPDWLWDGSKWWARDQTNPKRPAYGCIEDCDVVSNPLSLDSLADPNHPSHRDYRGIAGPLDVVPTLEKIAIKLPPNTWTILEQPSVVMREFSASRISPFFRVARIGLTNHNVGRILADSPNSGTTGPYRPNPRYYSPVGVPAADSYSWQPCMFYAGDSTPSNPSTIDIFSDYVIDQFEESDLASIGQNDSNLTINQMCSEDKSQLQKITNQSGQTSAEVDSKRIAYLYFTWVDAIAKKVREKAAARGLALDSKKIFVLYYAWSAQTIDHPWKLDPLVMTSVTLDSASLSEPAQIDEMLTGVNSRVRDAYQRFHSIGIYEYMHGVGFGIPRIYNKVLSTSIRSNYTKSIYLPQPNTPKEDSQIFSFYAETYPNWGFDCSKVWIAAKLLWNQNQTIEELEEKYFRTLYGDQATRVKSVCAKLEDIWYRQNWSEASPTLVNQSNYRGFNNIRQLFVSDLDAVRDAVNTLQMAYDTSTQLSTKLRIQYFLEPLRLSLLMQSRQRVVAQTEAFDTNFGPDLNYVFTNLAILHGLSITELLDKITPLNEFTSNLRLLTQWSRYWFMFGANHNELLNRLAKQALADTASSTCPTCELDLTQLRNATRARIQQFAQKSVAPRTNDFSLKLENDLRDYGTAIIYDTQVPSILNPQSDIYADWERPFFPLTQLNYQRSSNDPESGFNIDVRETVPTKIWLRRNESTQKLMIAFESPIDFAKSNSSPASNIFSVWISSRSNYKNRVVVANPLADRINDPSFKLFQLKMTLSGQLEISNSLNQILPLQPSGQPGPTAVILENRLIPTQGDLGVWRGEVHLDLRSNDLAFIDTKNLNSCNNRPMAATQINMAIYARKNPSQLPQYTATFAAKDPRNVSALFPVANWSNNPGPLNSAQNFQLIGGPLLVFKSINKVSCRNGS